MDPITQQVVLATAGAAGAGEATYVDDVFSTFLYDGTAATHQIVNGIDLAGEGGLVWIQTRDSSSAYPAIYDTEGGTGPNGGRFFGGFTTTTTRSTQSDGLQSFNSDGVTLGTALYENGDGSIVGGSEYALWTFRKAPGFFDVVTYTGNGTSGRTISHNLGSVPGMIIIKATDLSGSNWAVYHRELGASNVIFMNYNVASGSDSSGRFSGTAPTSTVFSVGAQADTNNTGYNYVAYLFAHDDQSFGTDGDEAIIKCGSFTTNGSSSATINLGFEPQWLMYKRSDGGNENWQILDVMRGWAVKTSGMQELVANSATAEATNNGTKPTPTGFLLDGGHSNNATYIYMAIRRPHKPPEAGTDVFLPKAWTGTGSSHSYDAGFPLDLVWHTYRGGSSTGSWFYDRARGSNIRLISSSTSSEGSASFLDFDKQNSVGINGNASGYNASNENYIHHVFRRAPGFFDIATYTGTGSLSGVNHNLGVTPELKIIKKRSGTGQWVTGGTAVAGENGYFYLDSNDALHSNSGYWSGGDDSATKFSVKNGHSYSDSSGSTYVAYLFATLDGISKVGSYSGGSGSVDVDCGFTAGARFVLIKRTDSTGDWYVWDTARGIVSGNDPYLLLNSNAAEVTNTDYIDPLNAGFTVTSSAPAALNTSGGTYLFLAIA